MNVLLVTNIYPNNDPEYGGTAVCHSFTTEWVKLGYHVRVVHFDSLFPRPYYWAGKLFKDRIQAKTGTVAYTKTPRKPIRYYVDTVPVIFVPLRKHVPHKAPSQSQTEHAFRYVVNELEKDGFTPDIITAHFVLPQLQFMPLFKKQYPLARTCLVLHGPSSLFPQFYPKNYGELMSAVDVWGFRSLAFQHSFEKRFGNEKPMFLCHSGIPEKYIEVVNKNFARGVKHFVFVGSLYELKNVDITLRALHKAMDGKEYTFDIVGSGAEDENLHHLVDELGMKDRVVFHGQIKRDDAQNIVRNADCFVMVSSREAFGLVYVEAMAKGCIVIGTKGQGIDGIVKHGENGFLCKARDVDGLAEIINQIVDLPQSDLQEISSRAVATAADLTDKKVAEHYLEAIINSKKMDKYFVLLGENPLLWGQVCHLRELGYKVILVAWNDTPRIQGDMYIQKDIKDAPAIITELEARGLKGKIGGALSSIDLAAPTVNAINGWCGNKTMPEKFNSVLTKEEMRNAWMKAGVFNRISKMDDEFPLEEIYEASQRMKLICKPNVAASSRGITILEKGQTCEALQEALKKAKETSFDGRCLIEEFVEGEEFTVDMLGDAYGNVNCYSSSIQHHSLYALNNHVTVIHHWNSRKYDDETWVRIANFGIACYKALGLHSMFGHLEIIMKEDGTFTPVEMGARSSGFICSHTVWKASGHDYFGDYVRMLHGEAIEPGNYMNGPDASMWFGYDIPSHSHSVAETNITEFLDPRITVLFENHDGLKVGVDYGDYINDGDRDKFGYAILCGPREIMTYESVQESNEKFLDKFLGRK